MPPSVVRTSRTSDARQSAVPGFASCFELKTGVCLFVCVCRVLVHQVVALYFLMAGPRETQRWNEMALLQAFQGDMASRAASCYWDRDGFCGHEAFQFVALSCGVPPKSFRNSPGSDSRQWEWWSTRAQSASVWVTPSCRCPPPTSRPGQGLSEAR